MDVSRGERREERGMSLSFKMSSRSVKGKVTHVTAWRGFEVLLKSLTRSDKTNRCGDRKRKMNTAGTNTDSKYNGLKQEID